MFVFIFVYKYDLYIKISVHLNVCMYVATTTRYKIYLFLVYLKKNKKNKKFFTFLLNNRFFFSNWYFIFLNCVSVLLYFFSFCTFKLTLFVSLLYSFLHIDLANFFFLFNFCFPFLVEKNHLIERFDLFFFHKKNSSYLKIFKFNHWAIRDRLN